MENEKLTIEKVLKYANHDFINELQLVLMYIDLGNIAKAKESILQASERISNLAMLESLQLPLTANCIRTANWTLKAFKFQLTCEIQSGDRKAKDTEVANYLKKVFQTLLSVTDVDSEYTIQLHVWSVQNEWNIQLTVDHLVTELLQITPGDQSILIEEKLSNHTWTLLMSGQ
jgi:stage 0 sporulation protein B (sporulation initiation phosphotransferase)